VFDQLNTITANDDRVLNAILVKDKIFAVLNTATKGTAKVGVAYYVLDLKVSIMMRSIILW